MNKWMGIGAWLDRYDPETGRLLQVLRPNFAVVGEGAWDHIPQIQSDMGPNPLIILRYVGDGSSGINRNPDALAYTLMDVAFGYPGWFAAYGLNEPDISTPQAREEAAWWELEFVGRCHNTYGLSTVCLNIATGNPAGTQEDIDRACEELKPVHDATDYVGLHLYHLVDARGVFLSPLYTVYRYKLWPSWFDRSKLLCTEMGIDGTGGRRWGWRELGYEPVLALNTIINNWRKDGILGGAFFHLGAMSSEWDKYLMNEKIAKEMRAHNEGYSTLPEPELVIGEEEKVPEFVLGVKDEAERLTRKGVDVGLALDGEYYFLPDLAIQTTSTGFFLIRKFPDGGFEVQFHPKA